MLNHKINKLKLEKIKQIEMNYPYIYFFRYHNLNNNELINLKKEIQKINFNLFILKQNLIKYYIFNLKGQGPILILYGHTLLDFNFFNKLKKLELIGVFNNNLIFSNLKIKKIFSKTKLLPLNFQLKKPLFFFLNILKRI